MRTWRRPVAALATGLVLAACGATAPATPAVAVLLVAGRQVDFVRELENGFVEGVERVGGVRHEMAGPDIVDSARELRAFQAYRDGRHGSVALFTFAPELFADSLGTAAANGTPLIALHSIPAPGSGVPLYVGNDNTAMGTTLGEAMAEHLPADLPGVVVLGSPSPGVTVLDYRVTGVRAALQRLRPRLTVVGPFDTKQDPAGNLQAWRTLQAANPDALAFVGVGGADAHSLALLRGPHTTRVDGGFGTDPRALDLTAGGAMVLLSTEPYLQGLVAGAIQARSSKAHRTLPTGWIAVPGLLINTANAEEIIARQQSAEARRAWFAPQVDALLDDPEKGLRPLGEAV
jgi:ribose transport system substrate-binding protein